MILLDTNVVSETMKPQPDPSVLNWLNVQAAQTLYVSSVSFAELLFGVAALPKGQRQTRLQQAVEGLTQMFKDRTLSFDLPAAREYAQLALLARKSGKGFPTADGYIAAIAASKGFIVASRDTSAYVAVKVEVINPWNSV